MSLLGYGRHQTTEKTETPKGSSRILSPLKNIRALSRRNKRLPPSNAPPNRPHTTRPPQRQLRKCHCCRQGLSSVTKRERACLDTDVSLCTALGGLAQRGVPPPPLPSGQFPADPGSAVPGLNVWREAPAAAPHLQVAQVGDVSPTAHVGVYAFDVNNSHWPRVVVWQATASHLVKGGQWQTG